MTISTGVLKLTGPIEHFRSPTAIDLFLRSLAEDKQEKAICIILSGTGSHGTLGLKAIKAAGGMAIVQEPKTAEYPAMPESAIATGLADFVLPVEKMPEAMLHYVHANHIILSEHVDNDAELHDDLSQILTLLRINSRLDFRAYRKRMILRRIRRRMGLLQFSNISDYALYLHDHKEEIDQLSKDLLISVTSFFRDHEAWSVLETDVIKPLVQSQSADTPIRIWSAGCATGEEAYSVGMSVLEQLAASRSSCPIQIFATDVDEEALNIARQATYPDSIGADVSAERLSRYFNRINDHSCQITRELRETMTFARHNLLADAPFSRLDLVICRNQLIYLRPEAQRQVIELFHFALNPGGVLFLGPAESLGADTADLFEPISSKYRIYRRIGVTRAYRLHLPSARSDATLAVLKQIDRPVTTPRLADITQSFLLRRYALACVVINRNFEVLHFAGPTENYLMQPSGPPTRNVLAMARAGLASKLRLAVQQAIRENTAQQVTDVFVHLEGTNRRINFDVQPLNESRQTEGLLLVSFQDQSPPEAESIRGSHSRLEFSDNDMVHQLEQELETTREELQSTIEELESSNEELKASNEEVISMNEELQSANEEMETSKEELQSLNEELITVNNQLQDKVQELETAGNDIANLFDSTSIATVFLDPDFHIKRYTPASTKFFKLIPTDVGRPIADTVKCFEDNSLQDDMELVLQDLEPRESEVCSDERWWLRRVVPYRTTNNNIDGVVITFVDITERKLEGELAAGRLTAIVEGSADAIVGYDLAGVVHAWSKGAQNLYGYTAEEAIGNSIKMTLPEDRLDEWTEALDSVSRMEHVGPIESERITRQGERVSVSVTYSPIYDGKAAVVGISTIARNINEKKRIEAELLKRQKELIADLDALRQLQDASSQLVQIDEASTLLERILATAVSITSADMGSVQAMDASSNALKIIACQGFDDVFLDFFNSVHSGQYVCGNAMLRMERIIVEDIETSEFFVGTPALDILRAAGVRAVQSSPLISRTGELLGMLSTHYRRPLRPSDRDLHCIDLLARQAADWLERLRTELILYETQLQNQAIVCTASDAIITFDRMGTLQSVNPATEKMFGYAASKMLGENLSMLMPSPFKGLNDGYSSISEQSHASHVIGSRREVEGRHKDGSFFPIELAVSEVDDLDLFTGILRDISYRKDLERDVLDIATLERNRVAQHLHDGCGQDLTALGLMAERLVRSVQDQSVDSLDIAKNISQGVHKVLQEIRSLSQGLLQVEFTPSELSAALNELTSRLSGTSGIRCVFASDNNIPLANKLHATQLFYIAQEACSNAINHAQATNIQVHFRVANDGQVMLRIRDDGIGISDDHIEGSGLRIMRLRAALIGASLTVVNAQPRGTVVTCTLKVI
jgi:two-component system CheB/CheR fusion protein